MTDHAEDVRAIRRALVVLCRVAVQSAEHDVDHTAADRLAELEQDALVALGRLERAAAGLTLEET